MFRQRGRVDASHQGQKGVVQNVLSLAMAQTEGASVKNEAGSFGFVQGFAPTVLHSKTVEGPAWLFNAH
jgi:hypothetical protein